MKVVGLMGSPRVNSNTDIIMDKVLQGAKETGAEVKKIIVKDLQIYPCQGCLECRETGECRHYNDDVPEVIKELGEADGLVFGSPVWGSFIPGYFKMLFDRMVGTTMKIVPSGEGVGVYSRLPEKKRNGISIAVCASPAREMTEATIVFLNHLLHLHSNGGDIKDIRATGLSNYAQVNMTAGELEELLKQFGVENAANVAEQVEEQNRELLENAYDVGVELLD